MFSSCVVVMPAGYGDIPEEYYRFHDLCIDAEVADPEALAGSLPGDGSTDHAEHTAVYATSWGTATSENRSRPGRWTQRKATPRNGPRPTTISGRTGHREYPAPPLRWFVGGTSRDS